jgi:hypothetical protein
MATINIPDDLQSKVQIRATEAGFASVDDYVVDVLRRDAAEAAAVPEHLRVTSHEQLLALVRQGLASPAQSMTPADFERRRAELIAKHAPKAAG